ncbi:MAG TPA: sigma-70 family RNA polymerase sigma factor [Bryobacteraceae bacterium]|jgi:RNA polymerase sigma-70 factor (ECF subfamily)|nr:sigma-70 family RNA polymerase sigma factor [Bryobacteraceae bacterium]
MVLPCIEKVETGKDLIEGCQRGDPESFRALFEKHKDMVYSVALRYCGNAVVAQDIAQDTFLKLFSAIGSFRGDSSFDAWLYRMVVNSCFDQKRRTRRLAPLLDEVLAALQTPDVSALDEVLRTEMSEHIKSVVESLAPDQRMVVVLRYTQGLSYEEIAEILGCASGTIASRLNRAHKVLQRRLWRLAGDKRKW